MSLTFDGLTSSQTDKNHKETSRDFAYPSMFTNNLIGLGLSGFMYTLGAVMEGDSTLERIMASNELFSNCMIWGLAGSIGQIFIFLTISLFDCYLLTIITTTRKFFSVVYSNFRFGHNFDETQWLGASIVMICTFVELFSKKASKETAKDKSKKN
jgi:solute carrier family 35 (UDP-galactose transporter), member B1